MPSADRLKEFAEIVTIGSISGAARALGVPRATLSRRLSRLETELGTRLLHRGTRSLVPTRAGTELHRRALRVVADAEAAWAAVRRMDNIPRGLLRVTTVGPIDPQLFIGFVRDFPQVQLEVRTTTRHVDLVAEGVDIAIRFGEVRDPNLIARKVFTDRSVVVVSPEYLGARGEPKTVADLANHECIVGFAGEWAPVCHWPLWSGGTVRVSGRLTGNDIGLTRAAAVAGLGLALLPLGFVNSDLREKRLKVVLEKLVGAETPVSIVYADREFIEPRVKAFVDRAAKVVAKFMSTTPPG